MRSVGSAPWIGTLFLLGSMLGASAGRAEQTARSTTLGVHVHRERSAGACPDGAELWSIFDGLFPRHLVRPVGAGEHAGLEVSVVVVPHGAGYQATLRIIGEPGVERRLEDDDPECGGLGEALAVAIVLLVEPDAQRVEPPRSAGVLSRPASESVRARTPSPFWLHAHGGAFGGGGLLGGVNDVSGGAYVSVAADFGGPGLRARGLRLWSPRVSHGSGSVDVTLWGVLFGPCWRLATTSRWWTTPCVVLGLGRQKGSAHDYAINDSASRPWRVLGAEVSGSAPVSGALRAVATGGATFRLHDQTFLVGGEPATHQAPVGLYFSLGIGTSWEIVTAR